MTISRRTGLPAAVVTALLLGACASNVPSTTAVTGPAAEAVLHAGDRIDVRVSSATSDIALFESDAARIAEKINRHFSQASGSADGPQSHYRVDVSITDYDKGNEFIRAMLAGLGQIHTNAVVKVFALTGNMEISEFKVSNTYAPSGIYGATSRIQDIEDPFAQSVVDALQGRIDDSDQAGNNP